MEKYAIEVENLKIRYRCINKLSIRKSIFKLKKSNVEVYEALHGISFKVPEGEILGIIGKNGSGRGIAAWRKGRGPSACVSCADGALPSRSLCVMCLPQKASPPGTGLKQTKLRQGPAEAGMCATTRSAGSVSQA